MPSLLSAYKRRAEQAAELASEHCVIALRVALGIVYCWFGALKFINGLSPAAKLATDTMSVLTFHTVSATVSRPLLALMECLIGLGFVTGRLPRLTLGVFLVQMAGAMSPVLLLPTRIWSDHPLVPTLTGQYVIKDLILICAGIVVTTVPLRAAAGRTLMPAPAMHAEGAERERALVSAAPAVQPQ